VDQSKETIIRQIHDEACSRGDDSYIDPFTGFTVFTATYHKNRGHCCQSGCRHCPYGFKPETKRGLINKK